MTQASTWTVLPIQQAGKMPIDLQKAFVPIGMVGEQPIAVAVNKDVPVSNVKELTELANKTPNGLLFAATNRGGQSHLTGELFRSVAKANMSFVHSAGAAASLNDVIAGRRSRCHCQQGQRGPAQGHSAQGSPGPVPRAWNLHARFDSRPDRRVHAQRREAVVADRARDHEISPPPRQIIRPARKRRAEFVLARHRRDRARRTWPIARCT